MTFTTKSFTICLLIVLFVSPLFSQENAISDIPEVGEQLIINGHEIFTFKAELTGFTAKARLRRASDRINDLIGQDITGDVSYKPINEGMLLMLSNSGLFIVTSGDVDFAKGETTETIAKKVTSTLNAVFAIERERRSTKAYLSAIAQSLLATAFFVLLIFLTMRFFHKFKALIANRITLEQGKTQKDLLRVLHLEQIHSRIGTLIMTVSWIFYIIYAYIWATFALTRFPQTSNFGNTLGIYLETAFTAIISSIAGAIPNLLIIAIIALIGWMFNRSSRLFFDLVEQEKVSLPGIYADTAQPTRRIVTTLIWIFSIIAAYPYLPGSGSEAFKGISIMLGLIVSLGSSGIMSQAMSGLILMYSRTFRPGDFIKTGDVEGVVLSLGMLSTKIRNIRNEELTIPNAVLVSSATTNFTRLHKERGLIISTGVTIGYNTPWRQVHAMLIMAAEKTQGLKNDPAPFVLQTALSDFYVEYCLHATVADIATRPFIFTALHQNILDVFNEYGVQIMSPNYKADPPQTVIVPKDQWYAEPAKSPIK